MKPPSAQKTAARLQKLLPGRSDLAIVLGSGFNSVVPRLPTSHKIDYRQLPGFPSPSVSGHAGKVVAGELGGAPVLLLCGRGHYYEGHSLAEVTFPIRVLAALGVRTILLTNAAGGINRRFRPGDFMSLADHINFLGANPLRGTNARGFERFLDLSQVYDAKLRSLMARAARQAGVRLHSGVYLAVSGPSYETPAEIRAFARLGADAVGMSTVPEAIVARQCGLTVAGLSCITNRAAGRSQRPLAHADVLEAGRRVAEAAATLLEHFARLHVKQKL